MLAHSTQGKRAMYSRLRKTTLRKHELREVTLDRRTPAIERMAILGFGTISGQDAIQFRGVESRPGARQDKHIFLWSPEARGYDPSGIA